MYSIELSATAEKQLYKLNKEIQKRIISTLERIRVTPHSHVKKLIECPYFRLRVGDYRIILNILGDKLIIFVIEIGRRKNVYV